LPHRYHRITTESVLSLRFSERLALEMVAAVLWPLATDERIGLLLTTLADNLADVAETDEEVAALVERLRLLFKLECLDRHMANSLEAEANELGAPTSDDKTNH
jgi:hypothetical protein